MELYESRSEAETCSFGRRMGEAAAAGDIYCLCGDLGTGKTAFAKGFAAGLGVTAPVISPTFTIVREYTGRLPLYHFDIYRLGSEDELWDVGWEDYTAGQGVCLVEWADQLAEAMPPEAHWIWLEKDLTQGTEYRRIRVAG